MAGLPDTGSANPFSRGIGRRISDLRQRSGISLSELSRRSGIAKGTLSRLEAGHGNPTVMTLAALAAILKVTPSDFMDEPEVREPASPHLLAGPGIQMLFVHRTVTFSVWEVYETTIPRLAEPIVSDTHGGTEHLLMIEGEAEVGPLDATRLLRAGEHISFPGRAPHAYWSPKGPARLLLIMEYPRSEPDREA